MNAIRRQIAALDGQPRGASPSIGRSRRRANGIDVTRNLAGRAGRALADADAGDVHGNAREPRDPPALVLAATRVLYAV